MYDVFRIILLLIVFLAPLLVLFSKNNRLKSGISTKNYFLLSFLSLLYLGLTFTNLYSGFFWIICCSILESFTGCDILPGSIWYYFLVLLLILFGVPSVVLFYYALHIVVPNYPCPDSVRPPENAGRNAETGGKLSDEIDDKQK